MSDRESEDVGEPLSDEQWAKLMNCRRNPECETGNHYRVYQAYLCTRQVGSGDPWRRIIPYLVIQDDHTGDTLGYVYDIKTGDYKYCPRGDAAALKAYQEWMVAESKKEVARTHGIPLEDVWAGSEDKKPAGPGKHGIYREYKDVLGDTPAESELVCPPYVDHPYLLLVEKRRK